MIVAADLEGTLSTGATWKGVARYLVKRGRGASYKRFLYWKLPSVALVKLGLMPEQPMRDRWMIGLAHLMTGFTEADVEDMAEWVVEQELWPNRRLDLMDELARHRRQGARIMLVSGTYSPVLRAFARRMGAEAYGTELALSLDPPRVELLPPINTGPVKVASIRRAAPYAEVIAAYGDSIADLPMLELSREPVAVQPDKALRRVARERGWRVV